MIPPQKSIRLRLTKLTPDEEAFLGFICLSLFTFGMVIQGVVLMMFEPTIPHLWALSPGISLNIFSAFILRALRKV